MHWATLKGRTRTSGWRTWDFYFAQCANLLGNAQVCTEHSLGDASQETSFGSAQRTARRLPEIPALVDVIKEHRKCGDRGGATCGAESRLMLRKFPSWEQSFGLAGGSLAVLREASLPCCREPSVRLWARGYGESGLGGGFSPLLVHAYQRLSPSHWGMEKKLYSGSSCVGILELLPPRTLSCPPRTETSRRALYVRG